MKLACLIFLLLTLGCRSPGSKSISSTKALQIALTKYETGTYGPVEDFDVSIRKSEIDDFGSCWLVLFDRVRGELTAGSFLIVLVSEDGARVEVMPGR